MTNIMAPHATAVTKNPELTTPETTSTTANTSIAMQRAHQHSVPLVPFAEPSTNPDKPWDAYLRNHSCTV